MNSGSTGWFRGLDHDQEWIRGWISSTDPMSRRSRRTRVEPRSASPTVEAAPGRLRSPRSSPATSSTSSSATPAGRRGSRPARHALARPGVDRQGSRPRPTAHGDRAGKASSVTANTRRFQRATPEEPGGDEETVGARSEHNERWLMTLRCHEPADALRTQRAGEGLRSLDPWTDVRRDAAPGSAAPSIQPVARAGRAGRVLRLPSFRPRRVPPDGHAAVAATAPLQPQTPQNDRRQPDEGGAH